MPERRRRLILVLWNIRCLAIESPMSKPVCPACMPMKSNWVYTCPFPYRPCTERVNTFKHLMYSTQKHVTPPHREMGLVLCMHYALCTYNDVHDPCKVFVGGKEDHINASGRSLWMSHFEGIRFGLPLYMTWPSAKCVQITTQKK